MIRGKDEDQNMVQGIRKRRQGRKATTAKDWTLLKKGNLAWYEKVGGGRSGGGGDGGGDGVRVEGVGRLVRPPGQRVEGSWKGRVSARRAGRTKG